MLLFPVNKEMHNQAIFRRQMNISLNYNSHCCRGYEEPGPPQTLLVPCKLVQASQKANAKLNPALKLFQRPRIFL